MISMIEPIRKSSVEVVVLHYMEFGSITILKNVYRCIVLCSQDSLVNHHLYLRLMRSQRRLSGVIYG